MELVIDGPALVTFAELDARRPDEHWQRIIRVGVDEAPATLQRRVSRAGCCASA